MNSYWGGADADAESAGWPTGGIFGSAVATVTEVLDELSVADGPFSDGKGGFRERPGLGNILGAEEVVQRRHAKSVERASMLVLERIIDELPDVREKFVARLGTEALRKKLLEHLTPNSMIFMHPPPTLQKVLETRVKNAAYESVAEVFRRAYAREIERAETAVRLGAFERAEWCEAQAEKVLAAPTVVAKSILDRIGKVAARAQHIRVAMTEPLKP